MQWLSGTFFSLIDVYREIEEALLRQYDMRYTYGFLVAMISITLSTSTTCTEVENEECSSSSILMFSVTLDYFLHDHMNIKCILNTFIVSIKWYTYRTRNVCENCRTNWRGNCHLAFNHCRRIACTYYCNHYLLYSTSVSATLLYIIDIWCPYRSSDDRSPKIKRWRREIFSQHIDVTNVIFCRHRNYFSRSVFVSLNLFFLQFVINWNFEKNNHCSCYFLLLH